MSQNGYKIIAFQYFDPKIGKDDFLNNHTLIQLHYPFILTLIGYLLKGVFRPLNKVGLSKLSKTGDLVEYFINSYFFFLKGKNNKILKQADIIIAGDPPSMFLGNFLIRKSDKKLIFWELELLLTHELKTKAHKYFKKKEIEASKHIICAIEFGEKRSELLRLENKIHADIPIFVIPNSTLNKPEIKREYYFNDYFKIPKEKKIILAAGSVSNDFNEEMECFWETIRDWPDDWVFVMHSRVKLINYLRYPKIPNDLKNSKIFIHDNPFPPNQVNTIYNSCNIGILPTRFEGKINDNLFYSELSLGKLFHFVNNGIPIISRRLYGYEMFIDHNSIGFSFRRRTEIQKFLELIFLNENYYKLNCINFSLAYSFDSYHNFFKSYLEKSYS